MSIRAQHKRSKRVRCADHRLHLTVLLGVLTSVARSEVILTTNAGSVGQNLTLPSDWNGTIPIVITNKCGSTIWPGIGTQAGTGPGTGGFELDSGASKDLWVSPNWQGRVWGRTNCTVNGDSCTCKTGDCSGQLSCGYSVSTWGCLALGYHCVLILTAPQGSTPATLVEFNLAGGQNGMQTYYDISLVDGYNLPVGINYLPAKNTSFIPPNLTNCACIATAGWLSANSAIGSYYSNSTYPVPLEPDETNKSIEDWCPWPLLAYPPKKPGDGVYPYPDDNVKRPEFSPCNSACAATGSDKDCCTGKYHNPNKCKPSLYSRSIKAICPDAYSYAYDDKTSTFSIPKGGGFEIIMCPSGRSTNILQQLGPELDSLTSTGIPKATLDLLRNATFIMTQRGVATQTRPVLMSLIASVVFAVCWLCI
jgi:hypothetical protein